MNRWLFQIAPKTGLTAGIVCILCSAPRTNSAPDSVTCLAPAQWLRNSLPRPPPPPRPPAPDPPATSGSGSAMPEHVRILLAPAKDQTIERCAQGIKGGFSHTLPIKPIGGIGQPRFHQHRIRDAEDFQLTYIALSPTRRKLQNHLWTHASHPTKIDPIPAHFLE